MIIVHRPLCIKINQQQQQRQKSNIQQGDNNIGNDQPDKPRLFRPGKYKQDAF